MTMISPEKFQDLCVQAFGPRYQQVDVAKFLDCSQSHVSHLKHGKASLSAGHLRKLVTYIETGRAHQAQEAAVAAVSTPVGAEPQETREEMYERILETFAQASVCVEMVANGVLPGMLIQGGPGAGKSRIVRDTLSDLGYTERKLADIQAMVETDDEDEEDLLDDSALVGDDEYVVVSGAGTPTGLVKLFWWVRNGGIVVIDDCDSLFDNLEALNLLKSALNTEEDERTITYLKEASFLKANGIKSSFDFKGRVIIITNVNIDELAESSHKMSASYGAVLDRCMPMNMGMYHRDEIMCRIEQIADGLFTDLSTKKRREVIDFLRTHQNDFKFFTLRLAGKVARLCRHKGWQKLVIKTHCR